MNASEKATQQQKENFFFSKSYSEIIKIHSNNLKDMYIFVFYYLYVQERVENKCIIYLSFVLCLRIFFHLANKLYIHMYMPHIYINMCACRIP